MLYTPSGAAPDFPNYLEKMKPCCYGQTRRVFIRGMAENGTLMVLLKRLGYLDGIDERVELHAKDVCDESRVELERTPSSLVSSIL